MLTDFSITVLPIYRIIDIRYVSFQAPAMFYYIFAVR